MNKKLPNGIPTILEYKELIKSNSFKEMEHWSDSFLSANKTILKDYFEKWVEDPFHQWSRQWEYPFVLSKIQEVSHLNPNLKILDAGSGVTFFPFFINTRFVQTSIDCCDYDKTLTDIFEKINRDIEKPVIFSLADIRDLPYEKDTFDIIYCISVLEHTQDFETVIEQFQKIIKPGGNLVVTFDISLDGTRDISVDKATSLLNSLINHFEESQGFSNNLRSLLSNPDIYTTLTANNINPALLPWKAPSLINRIKTTVETGKLSLWPPRLTVFCLSLTKHSA